MMELWKKISAIFALMAFFSLYSQNLYLKPNPPAARSDFDRFLVQHWKKRSIAPAKEAADHVMVRRLYIDLLGRVPSPEEALSYLNDKRENKQAKLVRSLLNTETHAMFITMRFGDELRIKSEFPINLWPNAAFLYTRTIYHALRTNMPYDQFVSCLILSDGSNFRNGYANFYRAVPQKKTAVIADSAAQFLFGKTLKSLSESDRNHFLKAFSGIRFKSTREWKEEIVYSDFLPEKDPRYPFVKWAAARKEFAEQAVRRMWRWIFGSENVDPQIVEYLAEQFRKTGFDQRAVLYEICTSSAYRVGSLYDGNKKNYSAMIRAGAVYPVRRLDAEVLADSIAQITGVPYSYSSVIPEPFSYYKNRAAALPDGSVTDQFLLLFGRPSRDSGAVSERKNNISAEQRLYLFNSTDLHNRLNHILRKQIRSEKDKFGALYLLFYSRNPTAEERKIYQNLVNKKIQWKLLSRMPWVLLNSREFLYQH